MRFLPAVFLTVMLIVPAKSVELFRYRAAAPDGSTLEYIFESDEQNVPQTATKKKVAEIAANFMTIFYGIQAGALETQELRTTPERYWLVAFSDMVKDRSISPWCCRTAE
jgi:hypothetical protein